MFNNMSIKFKMSLMVFIPAAVIFILLFINSYKSYNDLDELQKIEQVTILATKISALVHNTQKERGASAGFIGSKGKKLNISQKSLQCVQRLFKSDIEV